MKKIYGLFFSYREVNIFIAYSNKKKKVMRYLCNTLHLNDEITELFAIQEIDEEWLNNIPHHNSVFLIEDAGIVMPSIEWEIIQKEYTFFQKRFNTTFQTDLLVLGMSMDESGKYYWNEAMKEINSYSDKEFEDRLYYGFIRSHALLNNDGTLQAFTNRLEMINSFREGKLLDSECDMYSDLYYT